VLLCGRPDLVTKPGGDTRQILALQRCLGPGVTLSLELRPPLWGQQLVHVFNLSRPLEPALQAAWAREAGLPVVCTPIYQDLAEYNRRGRRGAGRVLFRALGQRDDRLEDARALANLLRAGVRQLAGRPRLALGLLSHALGGRGTSAVALQRGLLVNSVSVVFNSSLEASTVRSRLKLSRNEYIEEIVPVGIDPAELGAPDPGPFERRYGAQPETVLCVGRIEDLKNQLTLIRALRDEPLRLVLVGDENPLHRGFARAVRRAAAARPRTLLLSGLSRGLLLSAMAAARVHVLASWFETAGLVSLEAAACGCAVVSTSRGYARAYLGDEAHYCDPGDPRSIREAVLAALQRGPAEGLRRRVLQQLTVQRAAGLMRDVYLRAVA
jgi:hypothetical protein